MSASAIYQGRLEHARRAPRAHRFGYDLCLFYLDLDELDAVLRQSPLLRSGRFGLLSFDRRDYAGLPERPLKGEVLDLVEARLGARPAGPVRLLTQVRWLGYVFNPVSFYYCFAADGVTLDAMVAEITNTPWGERHAYVLPAGADGVRSAFPKAFHVSPFFPMEQRYAWTACVPGDRLTVTMVNREGGAAVFSATLTAERRPLTTGTVARVLLRYPFMAWRVPLAIYWQALRLWSKGTPFHPHPTARLAAREER